MTRRAARHATAALLAALVVATTAGCGSVRFSKEPADAPSMSSPAPSSKPSGQGGAPSAETPAAKAPPTTTPPASAPAPTTPSPTTGGPGSSGVGTDCAGNPSQSTEYLTAESTTVDLGSAPSPGIDVAGHPATLVCGGPDDLRYDTDTSLPRVVHLDATTRVAVLPTDATTSSPLPVGELSQWIADHPGAHVWAWVTAPGVPPTFTEMYHP